MAVARDRRKGCEPRRKSCVFVVAAGIALFTIGCVDLTPPWQQGLRSSLGGGGLSEAGTPDPLENGNVDADPADVSSFTPADLGPDLVLADTWEGSGGAPDVAPPKGGEDGRGTSAADGSGATGGAGGASGSGGQPDSGSGAASGGGIGAGGAVVSGRGGSPGGGAGGGVAAGGAAGTTVADAAVDGDVMPSPLAYFPCEAAVQGSVLPDTSGHGNNATLASGSSASGAYAFASGKVGNALDLSTSAKGYVLLPQNLLANAREATIATWVYVNHSVTNQRVFDFGKDTKVYMYLTSKHGLSKHVAFDITVNGYSTSYEQSLSGPAELAVGAWSHVAVVLGAAGAVLYVNGKQVAASASVTLRPADLGNLPNYYIGRSQYPNDPYFDGNIDELRIYDRALSAGQIQTLAGS